MKPAKQAKHTVTTRIPQSHYRRLERIAKATNTPFDLVVNKAIRYGLGCQTALMTGKAVTQ